MGKRIFSWVVIALFGVITTFMCSACSLLSGTQTVKVTYYVDGEVWREITVNEGDLIILPKYESETEIFNGWQVNGQGDALTGVYVANGNTVFIANLRELAKLTFYVNNQVWKVDYADPSVVFFLPTVTDTVSYKFNGWKINGQGETLTNSCIVDEATVFVADITDTGKRLLTYIVDGGAWQTAEVDKNTATPLATVTDTKGRIFKGWKVNGTGDVYTNYTAQEDTVLVAHFTCQVNFNNNGKITSREVDEGTQITLEILPNTDTQGFVGWQIDGTGELLTGNYTVNSNTNFVSCFADLDWVAYDFDLPFYGNELWDSTDSSAYMKYISGYKMYSISVKSDSTFIKELGDFLYPDDYSGNFSGYCVWKSVSGNTYYSDGQCNWIMEPGNSLKWTSIEWKGLPTTVPFYGFDVWNNGTNTYWSNGRHQYVLDEAKLTWKVKTWNIEFNGNNVWTDGQNYYYSEGTRHYVLKGSTWVKKDWGNNLTDFNGSLVWTDGTNYYYSEEEKQYVLNSNGIWVEKIWVGFVPENSSFIWQDQRGCYFYSNGTTQYLLISSKG